MLSAIYQIYKLSKTTLNIGSIQNAFLRAILCLDWVEQQIKIWGKENVETLAAFVFISAIAWKKCWVDETASFGLANAYTALPPPPPLLRPSATTITTTKQWVDALSTWKFTSWNGKTERSWDNCWKALFFVNLVASRAELWAFLEAQDEWYRLWINVPELLQHIFMNLIR